MPYQTIIPEKDEMSQTIPEGLVICRYPRYKEVFCIAVTRHDLSHQLLLRESLVGLPVTES